MADYAGALDQGTTSTRFMVFDHSGQVVAIDQKEHEQIYPKPGWVEHDPMEIWERSQSVIRAALDGKGARSRAESGQLAFGNIDTWCIWNLTGGPNGGAHVTDVSNASRTLLMNLETLDWDDEILDLMTIPRAMLPEVRASSEEYGKAVGDLEGISVAG